MVVRKAFAMRASSVAHLRFKGFRKPSGQLFISTPTGHRTASEFEIALRVRATIAV
jgi:hypothetical protein